MALDLKKVGIWFLLLTATVFGAFTGVFTNPTFFPHLSTIVLLILAVCIIIAHYLISKKKDEKKRRPVELWIILIADFVFGLFIGARAEGHPEIQLITAALLAICGFIGLWLLFLRDKGIVKV